MGIVFQKDWSRPFLVNHHGGLNEKKRGEKDGMGPVEAGQETGCRKHENRNMIPVVYPFRKAAWAGSGFIVVRIGHIATLNIVNRERFSGTRIK
jgi:hypothetical protein